MSMSSHSTPPTGAHNQERLRLALLGLSYIANDAIEKAEKARLDKSKIEEIHREFDALKARVRTLLFDWEKAVPSAVETFRSPSLELAAVRLRVQITDIEKAVQVEVPMDDRPDVIALLGNRPEENQQGVIKTLRTMVTVMGDQGQLEDLLPVTDRQLIERLVHDRFSSAYSEVLAIVVTVPEIEGTGRQAEIVKRYRLLPIDVRPLKTALQLVAPTPGEIQRVTEDYLPISEPLPFIVAFLTEFLGIQGLERLPILREAIEFQVISAVTEGERANTALAGPPGVGKSLVGKAAKELQPIAREALPTKITEAGLIGVGSSSPRRDSRQAGLLPQADQGVFVVQDWHQANSVKNQRLTASLATALQDGVVYDSSAARCSYRAQISLVIDANRQSDVRRTRARSDMDGLDQFVADTAIPTNILTRLTYVAEIPRSVEDQIRTLNQVLDAAGRDREAVQESMAQGMRHIKVWLAMMREHHRSVSIPNDVAGHLKTQVSKAINVGGTRLTQRAEYGDFMVRLADQAVMLTKAHARLHNRKIAVFADVDGIFAYLHRKMSFIRSLLFGADTAAVDVKASANGRQLLMKLRLKSGKHTSKQAQRALSLYSCSEADIADDLRVLYGEPDAEGFFHVGA